MQKIDAQGPSMIQIRRSQERGHAEHGWLDSFHSFSFADYHDAEHMGFGPLRVINEDRVQPGQGFGTHSHRDMEIISYVLEGGLAHKDSMGNGSVIRPGDVQRMSAGTGVAHSEYNASGSDPVHFLQIWIEPSVRGMKPSYEEKRFEDASKRGRLRLIGSPDGREGSVTIHQDANLYAGLLDADETAQFEAKPGRKTYVHVIKGEIEVNGQPLAAGDAIKIAGENRLRLEKGRNAEVLLFDLA
jgi:quercetin 2,3-dioxygenase